MRLRIRAALAAVLVALAGRAASDELTLEPARSELRFQLGATLHTVHGELDLVRGELHFDPGGGPASGELVVDARSARTGIELRDRDMHTKVLESERFPEIVLRAERLDVVRRDATSADVRLGGVLRIHGGEHAVVIPARVTTQGGDRLLVEASFTIPYVAWGLRDMSTFVLRVEKEIEVEVRALGAWRSPGARREPDGAPPAAPEATR
jgi:polyisoprenoid-binding protein YceI